MVITLTLAFGVYSHTRIDENKELVNKFSKEVVSDIAVIKHILKGG